MGSNGALTAKGKTVASRSVVISRYFVLFLIVSRASVAQAWPKQGPRLGGPNHPYTTSLDVTA